MRIFKFIKANLAAAFILSLSHHIISAQELHVDDAAKSREETVKDSAEDVFLSRFRESLRRTEAYFGEVVASGTLRSSTFPVKGEPTSNTRKLSFEFSGGASKWEDEPLGSFPNAVSGVTTVWCRNPQRYVLKLERYPSQKYFIVNQYLRRDHPLNEAYDRTMYRYIWASHAINGVPLSLIMDDSQGFSIESVKSLREGSNRMVHVKYRYSPKRDIMLRDGEIWLMPDYGWAISKYISNYNVEDRPGVQAGTTCRVEYASIDDGVAIPKLVEIEQRLGRFRIKDEFVIQMFAHRVSPLSDFTLTHYGLPDTTNPISVKRQQTFWVKFFLFNVAIIVVLIATIYRRNRRIRVVSPKSPMEDPESAQ